ncbi:MAG: endolytic transglycosylase MltG [Desulfovibrio sp.]|nr:endolytic transglycosylase MltG [Desulfovibrio sp.]
MKIFFRFMLLFILVAAAGGVWLWHEAQVFLETAAGQPGEQVIFDVAPGAHLNKIADDLQKRGLITSARNFALLARWKKQENRLQAGRFALESGSRPEAVLEALVNGRPVLQRVTVPEGLTWWQTGRLLENEGLVRFEDFREAVTDPEFLRHYGIPFATAEGFLMPDTYLLKPPDAGAAAAGGEAAAQAARAQARAVAGRMIDNFWRKAAPLWPGGAGREGVAARPPGPELRKWVTLASIVEKETGIPEERARVAGVYENRLGRGMLLQADPTVIYGLGPTFDGNLRRSQLDDAANAYNTYQRAGLPPGPIASFGTAALNAAIRPEQHGYLYFVAKTDGGEHQFSATLQEHNRAVREYLRQRRAARRGTP